MCHPRVLSSSRRRGSMHLVLALFLAFFFVACSDDDSSFATRPSGGSSSSVCEDCDDGSSSSKKQGDGGSEAAMTSSSSAESSSSSVTLATRCKTESKDNCEYGELVDDRDGQTYKTVKIGGQVWMVENLNYEVDSSFCYNDSVEYCEKYGRLYLWSVAVGKSESECGYRKRCSLPSGIIQGVCPGGWHLPSRAEWETLFNAVDGQSRAGKVLKSMSGWEKSGDGTDAFGFSTLPAGGRFGDKGYGNEGYYANFWSSTEYDSYDAYGMGLGYYYLNADLVGYDKYNWFSVRCIQD
ncbi:hypothetical protein B7994_02640 [Fibrobacter sp. UWR2]|nr:hypothetical protein B7994_02640 [Fibrobacter sp. UWR2]